MWTSTNVTNIYLASIRFGTLQYLCDTLYKSQHFPAVLRFLPYMSTKSYTLNSYWLQDCNVQSWKKHFFPNVWGVQQSFGGQKTIFYSRCGLTNFKFLFLSELGIYHQNLIPTRHMEPWEKCHFAQRGMLKCTYKGHFLTIEKAYEKFLHWKSKWWAHVLVPPLHLEVLIFEKKTKCQFLVSFQSFWN
jgi:hypothetical protein